MDVRLLYFDGCPSWKTADDRLTVLASELGLTITRERVTTEGDAERLTFRGSPTIVVSGAT